MLVALPAATTTDEAVAAGSQDLFPVNETACDMTPATMTSTTVINLNGSTSPDNPCRYVIEWRNNFYGPTGAQVPRRSLFWVYAQEGEYVVMGSSEIQQNQTGRASDIVLWQPDGTVVKAPDFYPEGTPGHTRQVYGNLDTITNAQLEAQVDWRCSTGPVAGGAFTTAGGALANMSTDGSRDGANNGTADGAVNHNTRGILNSRTKELAGARAINSGSGTGYDPCWFRVPDVAGDGYNGEGHLYAVAFYGPDGYNSTADHSATGNPQIIGTPGDANWAVLASGGGTRAWDLSVRASVSATADQQGRVFTFALAGSTGGEYRPLDVEYWLTTLDGFRYRIETNGIDPYGFLLFGNDEGFLNDDGTPLHHDVFGEPGATFALTTLMGGTSMDEPLYPMSFDGPLASAVLGHLGITDDPQQPGITALAFDGALGDNVSFGGVGGTFTAATGGRGTLMIVISSETKGANCDIPIDDTDAAYWDPTNLCNSTIYADIDAAQTLESSPPIPWYGRDNKGDRFPPSDEGESYPVLATLRGGEYHLPMIDLEGAAWGSPIITLENPPDAVCPTFIGVDGTEVTSCNQVFFDDRGYTTTWGGVQVGNPAGLACTAGATGATPNSGLSAYPYAASQYASDPLLGFNSLTEGLVRQFGRTVAQSGQDTNNGTNSCVDQQTALGNIAGLEIWTFYPSAVLNTHDDPGAMPDVVIIPETLNAVDDGVYIVPNDNTWYIAQGQSYAGTTTQSAANHPAAEALLTWNDEWDDDLTVTGCLVATDFAGTAWATSGPIFDATGTEIGDVELLNPATCLARYRFDTGVPNGSYTARYQLTGTVDTTTYTDIATVTFRQGTVPANDTAITRSGGAAVTGNVRLNDDACTTGGTADVDWSGNWVASPAIPYGTISPANGALANQSGTWSYTPDAAGTFSGIISRSYENNRTNCSGTATVTVTVVPVAHGDASEAFVDEAQGWDVGDGENLLANDFGANAAGAHIDTITSVSCAEGAPVCDGFSWNADGTWSYTPPSGWSGLVHVNYAASGAGGVSPTAPLVIRVKPLASNDTATYQVNQANTGAIDVVANDAGDSLTVTAVGIPVYETPCPSCVLTIDPDGTWHFTPTPGYDGDVSVGYTVTDAAGQTATATLTLTELTYLAAFDDGPYVVPMDATWYESTSVYGPVPGPYPGQTVLTWNDIHDPLATLTCTLEGDGDPNQAAWDGVGDIFDSLGADVGDIELLAADCSYRYRFASGTPAGTYTATYWLTDGTHSDIATVTFSQDAGAINDTATAYTTGVPVNGNVTTNDVCAADGSPVVTWLGDWVADPDYDPVGDLVANPDGTWSYTPNDDFSGVITRDYRINSVEPCDNDEATLTITVIPVAEDDESIGAVNVEQSGDALSNDHGRNPVGDLIDEIADWECLDGDETVCAGFDLEADGDWTYDPPQDWSGIAEFRYTALGAGGESLPAIISIQVLPEAVDDSDTFLATQIKHGNVLANDLGTMLGMTGVGTPSFPGCASGCSLTIGAGGAYTLTPGVDANGDPWVGIATIGYTLTDGAGASDSATLTLTGSPALRAVDDGPYTVPTNGDDTWYTAATTGGGGYTSNTNQSVGQRELTWNDEPDPLVGPTCQFQNGSDPTDLTSWAPTGGTDAATAGSIYDAEGDVVGHIRLRTATVGGIQYPCDYGYNFDDVDGDGTAGEAIPVGSYYSIYRLCDASGCDIAYARFQVGASAVVDFATTTTDGAQVSGNVVNNDVCTADVTDTVNWVNTTGPAATGGSTVNGARFSYAPWLTTPTGALTTPDDPSRGTWSPSDSTTDYNLTTTSPVVADPALVDVDGDWSYEPSDSYSGVVARDYRLNQLGRVYVVDYAGTLRVRQITPTGTGSNLSTSNFNAPTGVAFRPDNGNLYVINSGNNTIRQVTPGGTNTTWTVTGGGVNALNAPVRNAFDSAGNMYVLNTGVNPDSLLKITTGGASTRLAQLTGFNNSVANSGSVAVDNAGNIYITGGAGSSTITKVSPGGTVTTNWVTGLYQPRGITFAPDGNLYVTNYGGTGGSGISTRNAVIKVTLNQDGTGTPSLYTTPSPAMDNARGIAADAYGNLYISNTGDTNVLKIDASLNASVLITGMQNNESGIAVDAWGVNTTSCATPVAQVNILVKPVAVNDDAVTETAWATGDTPLVVAGNVLDGTNGTADKGRNSAANQIDRAGYVTCLDTDQDVCDWFQMQNGSGTWPGGCGAATQFTSEVAGYTGTDNANTGNGVWRFCPEAAWSGITQIRYMAYGAGGWSQPAFLTITVLPQAFDDENDGIAWDGDGEYQVVAGNVLDGSDNAGGDPDLGDSIQVLAHEAPAHGDLTLQPDGSYEYIPDPFWSGIEELDYTIVDADGQTATATLTITIAPVGIDDEVTAEDQGVALIGNVLDGTDSDGTPDLADDPEVTSWVLVSPISLPCELTPTAFDIAADGSWTCTLVPGFAGDIVIDYDAEDSFGQAYSATLTIHVPMVLYILKQGLDETDDWIPMNGSEWAIYTDEELDTPLADPEIEALPADGMFKIQGLPVGATYWLVETKALSGFALLAEPVGFTVSPTGAVSLVAGDSELIDAALMGPSYRITVDDAPMYLLPDAGGPGELPYQLGGVALLAFSLALGVAWFVIQRRRPRGRHAAPRAG